MKFYIIFLGILVIVFLIFGFFLFWNSVLAQNGGDGPICTVSCNSVGTSGASCDGHYCQILDCEKNPPVLQNHTICLPWQKCKIIEGTTEEGDSYCYFGGCPVTDRYVINPGSPSEEVIITAPCIEAPIKAPENPRYYDNPNYPTNRFTPERSINSENVFLPVKLDWDDVEGWKGGWIKEGELKMCLAEVKSEEGMSVKKKGGECEKKCDEIGKTVICLSDGPRCDYPKNKACVTEYWKNKCIRDCPEKCKEDVKAYQIKIKGGLRSPAAIRKIEEDQKKIEEDPKNTAKYEKEINKIRSEELNISEYTVFLDKSEFVPPACVLKSGQSYQWQVRACSSKNESTCGPWSSARSFHTNLAPEPVSPYDPDWTGPGKIENLSEEESRKLQWCEIEEPDDPDYPHYYEDTTWAGEKYYRPLSYKVLIYYGEDDLCHPLLALLGECPRELLAPVKGKVLPADKFWDKYYAYFTKKTPYAWKVAACKDRYGDNCSDYSQLWRFATADWGLSVRLDLPADDQETPIGLPVTLKWISLGGNSFNYQVAGVASGQTEIDSLGFDYPRLSLNTVYSWQVQPCRDYQAQDCEEAWYGPWHFKTTGQAPRLNYPIGNNIPIPTKFAWEPVGGAKSYVFKIQGGGLDIEKTVEKIDDPRVLLGYPDLKQEVSYSWQVKTCARPNGEVCGNYSNPQTFTTFRLPPPTDPNPSDDGQLPSNANFISWEEVEGARAYQYQIKYLSLAENETDERCSALAGKDLFETPQTTSFNSDNIDLLCLGEYQWQVRACLDQNCEEAGDWSSWNFSLLEPGEISQEGGFVPGGLVPCGRSYNDPNTSWNERENCQIKHLFLLIKIVIDFVFTKLLPAALILLTLATGVMFFLSFGGRTIPIIRIKLMWKWAAIGILLTLFAWTLVNLILKLVGFQISIFGNWYQI